MNIDRVYSISYTRMYVSIISNSEGVLPSKGSLEAAGWDLTCPYDVVVKARSRSIILLGIRIKLEPGTFGKMEMRSGLATKHGLMIMAGVVDSDYRGELKAAIYNSSDIDYKIGAGDRIAQIVIHKISTEEIKLTQYFDDDDKDEVNKIAELYNISSESDTESASLDADSSAVALTQSKWKDNDIPSEDEKTIPLGKRGMNGFGSTGL